MKFYDTHAHIYMCDDFDNIVNDFEKNNIGFCICPAVDYLTSLESINLSKKYPNKIYSSVGLHPNNQENHSWEDFIKLTQDNDIIALGETGLDYYREEINKKEQQKRLENHINLANKINKPLILHVREAADDMFSILKNQTIINKLIFHSFTDSLENAKKALDHDAMISFSGILTFKNAQNLRDILAYLPLDKILIETDSPYLSPEPVRGKNNTPNNLIYIAQTVAKIKNKSLETVAQQLKINTLETFKIKETL